MTALVPRFQFGLLAVFLATTLMCVSLVINTRPGSPRWIGHVMIDKPGFETGLMIYGWSYGWPWTYRTVSFKTDIFSYDGFDRVDWPLLAANLGVAFGASLAIAWLGERVLRASGRPLRRSQHRN